MTQDELERIVNAPEGKTLEFKRDVSSPKNIVRTVVAFSNSAGGKLIVGISDSKREIVGVEDPLEEETKLANIIMHNISPRISPDIEIHTMQGKSVLVMTVYKSNNVPHFIESATITDGVYVRVGSTNRKADRDQIQELQRISQGIHFDEQAHFSANIEDLDTDFIKEQFDGVHKITEKQLENLKIIASAREKLVPTNGGIALFGTNRQNFFPDLFVQCARFRGKTRIDFVDNIEIDDYPLAAIKEVEDFIKKHALRGFRINGLKREDDWNVPIHSIREVLVNAFVHMDYSQRGTPMKIAVLDDRIEVDSPGSLLPGLTIDAIKNGSSKVRNQMVARIFKELGYFDEWGTGIPRTIREIMELGFPEPTISETGEYVRFTVWCDVLGANLDSNLGSLEETKETKKNQLSKHADKLLEFAKEPRTREELLEHVDLYNNTKNAKTHITPLIEAGLLKLTVPDKPNSKLQRYYSE
ncbi:MAG: helix-turn-helix domain-containing protein [Candidatus Ancillula sp.]|jgi:predicted HTH transcriptional regulator|nr:helix-turn-helix domain-containing protein [Candidatus Ancillula sp.]